MMYSTAPWIIALASMLFATAKLADASMHGKPGGPPISGSFSVSGGHVLDPHGNIWIGNGVAVMNSFVLGMFNWQGGAPLAANMLTVLPKTNVIRLAFVNDVPYNTVTPAQVAPFVNYMTARGIVVVIEDHDYNHTVLTGSALTTESNWYASMATYYINNKYVMFQTMNEPNVNDSAQMQATYNAIRATGSNAIVFMEAGTYANATTGSIGDTTVFATMHNVVWDFHIYQGVLSPYCSPCNTVAGFKVGIDNRVAYLQSIPSADGVMPVLSLEGGNSTSPPTLDTFGNLVVDAAFQDVNIQAFAAWHWNDYNKTGYIDNLTAPSGSSPILNTVLTSPYGIQVGGYIAAGPGPVTPP